MGAQRQSQVSLAILRGMTNTRAYWIVAVLMALALAIVPLLNASTARSQVLNPTGVLDLSIKNANLTLNQAGQVKEASGQMEIKNRQYQGVGPYRITVNGSTLPASQMAMTSELKLKGDIGEYKGTITMDVSTPPGGRITLELRGTATREVDPVDGDIKVVSGGSFKSKGAAGPYASLAASGSFIAKINERDGQLGSKITLTLATTGTAPLETPVTPSSTIIGGPFEGVSGPGYPTGPLNMVVIGTQLGLDRVGQVKDQPGKLEVKDRQYEAHGFFPVTINGTALTATEIKVISNLKLEAKSSDHQGSIDVDIDTVPGGHVTLNYRGTATISGSTIISTGTFKTSKTTGIFDGLVADGTYEMSIVELGDTAGSQAMVTILTKSIFPSTSAAPASSAIIGGPFEGVSGPGYPTGPLDTSMKSDLTLSNLGQVKGSGEKQEIKDRKYEGTGEYRATINGAPLTASQVVVTSILKFNGATAQHQGKIDIEVNEPAAGHITLEYQGTASQSLDPVERDIILTSGGLFKSKKMSGIWADLVSDGTYSMKINERDGTLGKKVTITIETVSSLSAAAAAGGPFEGVSGPGYPTGPLNINTGTVTPLLNRVGQVKAQADKLEIKDRQYEANGALPVTINGAQFTASEIKVISNLKASAGTGQHQGTIDVDIDILPGGHVTLGYQGTATIAGSTITSTGRFKTRKTTGMFAGLVADGTYDMTIVESGDTEGSVAMVTISTGSTFPPPAIAGWDMAVTKAEFNGVRLLLEVRDAEPNSTIMVGGVAVGTADAKGKFRTELPGFTPPASCQISVSDPFDTRVVTLNPCAPAGSGAAAPPSDGGRVRVPFQMTDTGLLTGATGQGTIELRKDKVPSQLRLGVTAEGTSRRSGTITTGVLENATYSLCMDGRVMTSAVAVENPLLGVISLSLQVQEATSLNTVHGSTIKVVEGTNCARSILEARIAVSEADLGWDMAITKAEFNGVRLLLEVRDAEPSSTIMVGGVAVGTADVKGKFRTELPGFTPPASCQISVSDPFDTRVVTLNPCAPAGSGGSAAPPPATSPPPSPPPPSQPPSGGATPDGGLISSLSMSIPGAQLLLERMGNVKEQGGQVTEIKERKYQGLGAFQVTLNGAGQTASEISINSSLIKVQGGTAEHQGSMVIRVVGVGNLDLAFKGTAQLSGNTIMSTGTFKMTKSGDNFLALASAEGTYDMTIVESATAQGSPVTLGISIVKR